VTDDLELDLERALTVLRVDLESYLEETTEEEPCPTSKTTPN
jgi:hypothetical protein